MKKLFSILLLMTGFIFFGQNPTPFPNGVRTPFIISNVSGLGINTNVPKAALDIESTTNGLLIPRMTTAEKNLIASPDLSELVFDTNLGVFQYYNGTTWVDLSGGGGSETSDLNDVTLRGNFTEQDIQFQAGAAIDFWSGIYHGYLNGIGLTGSRTWALPDVDATLVASVNGIPAGFDGNVDVPGLTPQGFEDVLEVDGLANVADGEGKFEFDLSGNGKAEFELVEPGTDLESHKFTIIPGLISLSSLKGSEHKGAEINLNNGDLLIQTRKTNVSNTSNSFKLEEQTEVGAESVTFLRAQPDGTAQYIATEKYVDDAIDGIPAPNLQSVTDGTGNNVTTNAIETKSRFYLNLTDDTGSEFVIDETGANWQYNGFYSTVSNSNTTGPHSNFLPDVDGTFPVISQEVNDGEVNKSPSENAVFQAIAAIPAPSSILTTSIVDGDTTHAPNGNVVFDNLALKENLSNKSTDVNTDQGSNTKYPSVKAVYDWATGLLALKQAVLTAANFGSFSSALSGKTTPLDADTVNISDSAASGDAKKLTLSNFWTNYFKGKADAVYQSILTASNFSTFGISTSNKTIPVDSDTFLLFDSAASDITKKVTATQMWTNYLKGKSDALYLPFSGGTLTGALIGTSFTAGASNNIGWTGRTMISSGTDGVLTFTANGGGNPSRITFGSAGSTNPALTKDGNDIAITNGNNSADRNIRFAGMRTSYVAKTATYSIADVDYTVDCTSGTFTVTLPTAVGVAGKVYVISNSGAGTITIATTSSQTFANVTATPTTLTMATVGARTVQSNGANWLLLSSL